MVIGNSNCVFSSPEMLNWRHAFFFLFFFGWFFPLIFFLVHIFFLLCSGCMRLVRENLNWGSKPELKSEVLRGIKEIGSVLYWMGLLDIVLVTIFNSLFSSNSFK